MNYRSQAKTHGRLVRRFSLSVLFLMVVNSVPSAEIDSNEPRQPAPSSWSKPQDPHKAEPFWGQHQAGIVTPPQHHTYFAAFDLVTTNRADLAKLFQAWTLAAARMAEGKTAQPLEEGLQTATRTPADSQSDSDNLTPDPSAMSADSGETIGMSPSRLTLTFGFGPTLFTKDGQDRFGLASRRPAAFVDLPKFSVDQLIEERTGGDLSVQACAEDPQVAFHAVRQLARIAAGVAQIRWVQTGFRPSTGERHLLGFSNGKGNPSVDDPGAMAKAVWVGQEGPDWMKGGTYVVARRIRFAIEHWDQMPKEYQEKAVGQQKYSVPAISRAAKGASLDSASTDVEAVEEARRTHLGIVLPGALTMLRRSFSYNDGVNFITERWPPWRQGLEYDAGMLFICYQRDPATGFIKMNENLAKFDYMLNQFWTHVGGGLFACPPGVQDGEYLGQHLFEP